MHYTRWRRNGDPLISKNAYGAMLARLDSAASSTSDDCVLITTQPGRRPVATYNGRCMPAARAVWTIANGDPGDEFVLHTCGQGVQGCINIRHLYLGDAAQNAADAIADGTLARGERGGSAKLTEREVLRIRAEHGAGRGYGKLAAQYSVSRSQIARIVKGESWAHLV
jgi:hypothetical protein